MDSTDVFYFAMEGTKISQIHETNTTDFSFFIFKVNANFRGSFFSSEKKFLESTTALGGPKIQDIGTSIVQNTEKIHFFD